MRKLTKFEIALFIIIFAHAIVLFKAAFFPYPELFVYPYLTNLGLTPYAQILDQHFPGLMFFPVNLANLGFTTPDSFRFLQIGVVALVHLLLFKTALSLTGSKKIALAGNILFFLFHPFLEGNVLWIDSFMPLLLLPAFYLILNKDNKNIFFSGIFIGLAILLKQVTVPLAVLFMIWLWFSDRKLTKYFLMGVSIPCIFLILFVLRKNILGDFIFWTYTFNITTFAQMGRKYATFRQLLAISVIFDPAILVSLWGIIARKTLLPLFLFLLGCLVFAYARFDYVHLQPALPFAILALVFLFSKLPKGYVNGMFLLYLIPVVWVSTHFYLGGFGESVKFFGETEYKVADKVMAYASENDPVFMYGTLPHMYQMTRTRPAGDVFVFHFPWFMKVAEDRVLAGLVSDPPKVVVRQASATIDGESLYLYMPNIEKYILENYEKIDEVGDIDILVSKI